MLYVSVILPVPVDGVFSYELPQEFEGRTQTGSRVVVPFGVNKLYTGIVVSLSDKAPEGDFKLKQVSDVLDPTPVVGRQELCLWQWVADYYMCSLGDVMKAALPGGLKLTSETSVRLKADFDEWDRLTKAEMQIMDLLHKGRRDTIASLQKAVPHSILMRGVRSLMEKGVLEVNETLVEGYKPKREVHVRLCSEYLTGKALNELFESLANMPRRYALLHKLVGMAGIETALKLRNPKLIAEVSRAELLKEAGVAPAVLLGLKAKGVIEQYDYEVKRLRTFSGSIDDRIALSADQQAAFDGINKAFVDKDVCLLHGVTSSGKTEIYIQLIKQCLGRDRRVLYLLPEIALTTQITKRLQRVFGDRLGVYHSKFPDVERVEMWQKQLGEKPYDVVLGVRSSLFLPQRNLGLVIVDEEHETSYKQQDPAPRYSGREVAMMLARQHGAKVLLGSATPSVESYFNAMQGRYGYVRLDKRFGDMQLPEIVVADVRDLMRRKMMKPPFSPRLEEEIRKALELGEQVILFQNRRGYAPVVECVTCGWVPTCQYCDVSLTYHHDDNRLHCHYCGNTFRVPSRCPNCDGQDLHTHGFGTEKIEEEVHRRFPKARTVRMDLDTTRSRNSYERIIDEFSSGRTDILIGTQMVSKGLDFDRVHVVGILDADAMFTRPDFRSHERAFQMMSQVSGRAGRRARRGLVVLQTRHADYPLIHQVVCDDYSTMCREQLAERKQFYYPPFFRLIYIWFKHRDEAVVNAAAQQALRLLLEAFGGGVLGPDKPLVAKVRMLHLRKAALKVSPAMPPAEVRAKLRGVVKQIVSESRFRSVMIYFDVDPL